jgi:hypothetical protein
MPHFQEPGRPIQGVTNVCCIKMTGHVKLNMFLPIQSLVVTASQGGIEEKLLHCT